MFTNKYAPFSGIFLGVFNPTYMEINLKKSGFKTGQHNYLDQVSQQN